MYMRILRCKSICYSLILFLILFTTIWYFYLNSNNIRTHVVTTIKSMEPLAYKCCIPLDIAMRKNIFFLKTHKTGGSTVQNILLRFGIRHSLNIMWPIYYSYYQPFSALSLWPDTITPDNKYNILAYHMRYTSELRRYQYPDTATVTILRHPAALFQSLYDYFMMQQTVGMTFEQFLKAPIKPAFVWSIDSVVVYRGYNQMSVDLGFDIWNAGNQTVIDEFIKKIDDEFDFVMITEYMEASLVLLANLMGWPLDYMVHLKTNARPNKPNQYSLTEEDKSTLMELNQVDARLYDHFLEKFRKCARQYGEDKLNEEIVRLRKMNKEFKERCVMTEDNWGILGAVNYVPKNMTNWECVYGTKLQIPLEEELRYMQARRLRV